MLPWLFLQPELLGPFFIVVGALVLIGLSQTLTAQQGSKSTGGFWDAITGKLYLQQLSGAVAQLTRYVVSRFAGAHLKTLAHWLRALGTVALGSFITPAENAEAVEDALRSLFVHGDPKARRAAKQAQATATHGVRVATRAEAGVRRDAQALNRYKATTNPRVRHATHAVDVTLPRDIAGIRRREEALSRDQAKLRERTTSLENGATKAFEWIRAHPLSAATGVFAGAVAVALARLGLGGLRCNNFKKVLRDFGCGLGTLLGRLLPLAVLLTVAFDFEEFVKASRFVAAGIGDAVAKIEGQFDPHLPPLPPPRS